MELKILITWIHKMCISPCLEVSQIFSLYITKYVLSAALIVWHKNKEQNLREQQEFCSFLLNLALLN